MQFVKVCIQLAVAGSFVHVGRISVDLNRLIDSFVPSLLSTIYLVLQRREQLLGMLLLGVYSVVLAWLLSAKM